MEILPAIDLYENKAVRLFKGDYEQMTVYSNNPITIAKDFENCGAKYIHLVDLEGAKSGETPNFESVKNIVENCSLNAEIGGGIRNLKTIEKYINIGVKRVILGTAAVNDEEFLKEAIRNFGEKIAVGIDIKDGFVAIKGWTEKSTVTGIDMCKKMQNMGVGYIICTDISKDGAMIGTNRKLYSDLKNILNINIIASGGVCNMEDILALKKTDIFGAIIGKAYYENAIDLKKAIEVAK